MNAKVSSLRILTAFILIAVAQSTAFAQYHLERITPVLNQPTFITQAPGDPENILYYTTRSSGNTSGTGLNPMGKVWRYDMSTRTSIPAVDFSHRTVSLDNGVQGLAFHPDFNFAASNGYGKIYVATAQHGTTSTNRVEEYVILNPDGSLKSTNDVTNSLRLILRYVNSSQNNHTVGWLGFDPNATSSNRNYLYISTGDGAFGLSYNSGSGTTGRPSQNPGDLKGKFLRVDISGGDDYPADTNKNFAIPPSNPLPVYNAANTNSPIAGLGEVYITGIRNAYRASFDRDNSDMFWGDVGENAIEEMSFLRAGSNTFGPPVDYGWPQLEGTANSPISGAPHTMTNPFTGVTSLHPLRQWTHSVGLAAIGGYVYRGPIPELRGKYFYSDFVSGRVWMLDFDRDTPPGTYNGSNGTRTEMTAIWNTNIADRRVPAYTGDSNMNTLSGLDHIVSFGEDNAGNLYIVDLGFGSTFSGQYTANAGEIFKIVPGPLPPMLAWTNVGGAIQLSWTGSFKLQSQTNSLSSGGWTDYPNGGSSPVTVPFDILQSSVYFRLIWPP